MINININLIVLTINVAMFLLFGFDKLMAKQKKWRIPEGVLFLGTALFGAFGTILGMVVFNHKTSKKVFRFVVPLLLLVNLVFLKNDFELTKRALQTIVDKMLALM